MYMKKITLHVDGTHCASCKMLIEDIINEQDGLYKAFVDLKKKTVSFETDLTDDKRTLTKELNEKLSHNGYTLSEEKISFDGKKHDPKLIWKAIPLGFSVLALFFILQRSGVLNIGFGERITAPTSFLIGLIASVSSCLAVVGGLVLSLSAKLAEDDKNNKRVFILFHIARIVSFATLGGLLGFLGGTIGINFTFSAILGILASIVMILLGCTLAGICKKNYITLPTYTFSFFKKIEHHTFAPIMIGFGTFFLPCGFTQSMQIQALSSGSFISGATIMFFFALGTFPVLMLLSYTSISFANSRYAPLFFKTAGIVVIGLGIFSLLGGLAGIGIINPLFNI